MTEELGHAPSFAEWKSFKEGKDPKEIKPRKDDGSGYSKLANFIINGPCGFCKQKVMQGEKHLPGCPATKENEPTTKEAHEPVDQEVSQLMQALFGSVRDYVLNQGLPRNTAIEIARDKVKDIEGHFRDFSNDSPHGGLKEYMRKAIENPELIFTRRSDHIPARYFNWQGGDYSEMQ